MERLPRWLDQWTDAAYKPVIGVSHVHVCEVDGTPCAFGLLETPHEVPPFFVCDLSEGAARELRVGWAGTIPSSSVEHFYPTEQGCILLARGQVWAVRPPPRAEWDKQPLQFATTNLGPLPADHAPVDHGLDFASDPVQADRVGAILTAPPHGTGLFEPLGPGPAQSLQVCSATGVWRTVHTGLPFNATLLTISGNGRRVAWKKPVAEVSEEAERGDWYTLDLTDSGAAPVRVTFDAQRSSAGFLSASGARLFYTANYSTARPITATQRLWVCSATERQEPAALTAPGVAPRGEDLPLHCIADFGFAGTDTLWVTYDRGVHRTSEIITLSPSGAVAQRRTLPEPPIRPECGAGWAGELCVHAAEGRERLPRLVLRRDAVRGAAPREPTELPVPGQLDNSVANLFEVEELSWPAEGPHPAVTGVLLARRDLPQNAPLLVWVHGGPTLAVECLLRNAAGCSDGDGTYDVETCVRPLLAAGYRVLVPAYRGTLGFGCEWAQGSVGDLGGCDLEDIRRGVEYLKGPGGRVDPSAAVGLYGGSYGGYMTMRALSKHPKYFAAGVAFYGFVDNRAMELETGDTSWEGEYVGRSLYPSAPDRSADVDLAEIRRPLLLIHGDYDTVCPASHSAMAYWALRRNGVPTEAIMYHKEGHGFTGAAARRDARRRTVAWFLRHMPPPDSCTEGPLKDLAEEDLAVGAAAGAPAAPPDGSMRAKRRRVVVAADSSSGEDEAGGLPRGGDDNDDDDDDDDEEEDEEDEEDEEHEDDDTE